MVSERLEREGNRVFCTALSRWNLECFCLHRALPAGRGFTAIVSGRVKAGGAHWQIKGERSR